MNNEELYNRVVANIKKISKKYGYKQYEMAEIIGISVNSYTNKINNTNGKFNLLQLKLIADELLMTIDELIGEV